MFFYFDTRTADMLNQISKNIVWILLPITWYLYNIKFNFLESKIVLDNNSGIISKKMVNFN